MCSREIQRKGERLVAGEKGKACVPIAVPLSLGPGFGVCRVLVHGWGASSCCWIIGLYSVKPPRTAAPDSVEEMVCAWWGW